MKRKSLSLILAALIILVFTFLYWLTAWSYDERTRLVPLVIGTPTLFLALLMFLKELKSSPAEEKPGEKQTDAAGLRNLAFILGWFILFFLLVLLFGFLIAIPLAMVGFLRFYQRQSWMVLLAATVVTWAVTYVMFELFMGFRLFPGILFGGLLL